VCPEWIVLEKYLTRRESARQSSAALRRKPQPTELTVFGRDAF